jgi:hypothetical protein
VEKCFQNGQICVKRLFNLVQNDVNMEKSETMLEKYFRKNEEIDIKSLSKLVRDVVNM